MEPLMVDRRAQWATIQPTSVTTNRSNRNRVVNCRKLCVACANTIITTTLTTTKSFSNRYTIISICLQNVFCV